MEINSSEYSISSPTVGMCPKDTKPEYAFIGRSNVGKSSLINMLCNHKGLAKTSSTPGKTLLINHFIINKEWYLVDLPGYGYAKGGLNLDKLFGEMMSNYFAKAKNLKLVLLLLDARREFGENDLDILDYLKEYQINYFLVVAKTDKINQSENIESKWLISAASKVFHAIVNSLVSASPTTWCNCNAFY